jgi:hypothetical protein
MLNVLVQIVNRMGLGKKKMLTQSRNSQYPTKIHEQVLLFDCTWLSDCRETYYLHLWYSAETLVSTMCHIPKKGHDSKNKESIVRILQEISQYIMVSCCP